MPSIALFASITTSSLIRRAIWVRMEGRGSRRRDDQESWRSRDMNAQDARNWQYENQSYYDGYGVPQTFHDNRYYDYEGQWRGQTQPYYDSMMHHAYPGPSSSSGYTRQAYYHQPARDVQYDYDGRSRDHATEEQSRRYERPAYRPKHVTREDFRESTPSMPQTRQYSTTRREHSPKLKSSLRSKPRKSYHANTFEVPRNYPESVEPPGPLPLLVLDLNGTLVFRGARNGNNAAERSKQPQLRPYLKSFLQYCLGIQRTDVSIEEHQDAWDGWVSSSTNGREQGKEKDSPHGTQFWRNTAEPKAESQAKFRLLLWSSAQPHNVDSMARAILSPEQAEQLLRVYARDTLVTRRLYSQKAPSIKDLEILWTVLNNESIGREGERRLSAEARDREDQESPDEDSSDSEVINRGAANEAARRAQERVIMPTENGKDYQDGRGYGQHNTLLLDDSVDKAGLQPFNHILLPEFNHNRAHMAARAMRDGEDSQDEQLEKSTESNKKEVVDDVLLQVVGVLEHARYQVNVSSWIRFGGLGDFGGMQHRHPYFTEDDVDGLVIKESLVEEAFLYFTKSSSFHPRNGPRLHTATTDRTQTFWAEEGTAALKRHGIPLQRF
jgi:hypothetical protein